MATITEKKVFISILKNIDEKVRRGQLVMTPFGGQYYKVEVVSNLNATQLKVVFIDHGKKNHAHPGELRSCIEDFFIVPPLAFDFDETLVEEYLGNFCL